MWKAVIRWSNEAVLLNEVPHDEHPYLDKLGWYAVMAAEIHPETHSANYDSLDILYLGDAFTQPLRSRISQPRPTLERLRAAVPKGKTAIVALGRPTNASRKKRGSDYLEGVLRALRHKHPCPVKDAIDRAPHVGPTVQIANEGDHHPLAALITMRGKKGPQKSAPTTAQPKVSIAPPGSSSTVVRRRKRAK